MSLQTSIDRHSAPAAPGTVPIREAQRKLLSGHLGVEITDPRVKLNKLSDADIKDLEHLLATRGVVVFRDQDITNEDQLAVGRRLGPLHVHHAQQWENHPSEILIVHSDEKTAATAEHWHADVSFLDTPPKISILRLETVPPIGGDTLFISTEIAYERLSKPLKELAKSLTAVHSGIHAFGYSAFKNRLHEYGVPIPGDEDLLHHRGKYKLAVNIRESEKDAPLPSEHPVARTHPITGRTSLYINPAFTTHIAGVRKEESERLLKLFYDHIKETYEAQIRVQWERPGTVVLFDHRVVWHAALNDFWPHTRTGYRVTVLGEKPYFDPAADAKVEPRTNPNWTRVLAGQDGIRRSLLSDGYTGKAKHTL